MPPLTAFVLGLLLGLAIGAAVVAGIVRSTSRLTGAAPRALPGLVLEGLLPGRSAGGIAAQRGLARRLKNTGQRTAAGRRVAASTLEVHVSPEDHTAIEDAMGLEAAQADLLDFYAAHASRAGWIVGATPELTIVRDISLRPRQAFVRAETRFDPATAQALRREEPVRAGRPPVAPRPDSPAAPREELTDVVPVLDDAAVTDVLPRALVEQDALLTQSYPLGFAEQASPGDLLVVHGTDVRVVSAARGLATVGRAPHNDIVVDAPGVADDHLLLEHRQSAWWIVPGPSGAKIALEGRTLRRAEQLDGQGVVELGRGARLRLTVEAGR